MKKIALLFVLLTALLCACTNQVQDNKPVSISANEQFVKTYFEHFNNHEWAKMASMYSETAEFKDPSLGKGIIKQTRQQIIDKYTQLNSVFPDLHDQVIQIYPSGEKHLVVEFVSSGTGPDGVKFELAICSILTIENGLITKDFTYFDNFDEEGQSKK